MCLTLSKSDPDSDRDKAASQRGLKRETEKIRVVLVDAEFADEFITVLDEHRV